MNLKTTTITAICALALLSTISGVTYSVFCDTETSIDNVMGVSTDYNNPIPEWLTTQMVEDKNNPKIGGDLHYADAGLIFSYNYTGTAQEANGNYTLFTYVSGDEFTVIDEVTSWEGTEDKFLQMKGSIDLGGSIADVSGNITPPLDPEIGPRVWLIRSDMFISYIHDYRDMPPNQATGAYYISEDNVTYYYTGN